MIEHWAERLVTFLLISGVLIGAFRLLERIVIGWLSRMDRIIAKLDSLVHAIPQWSRESERTILEQIHRTDTALRDEVQKTRHAVHNFHQAWLEAPENVDDAGFVEVRSDPTTPGAPGTDIAAYRTTFVPKKEE